MAADDPRIHDWMGHVLDEARAAVEHGDVPVGAVVVHRDRGEIVAARHNERERTGDPTAHAEVLALRDAAAALAGPTTPAVKRFLATVIARIDLLPDRRVRPVFKVPADGDGVASGFTADSSSETGGKLFVPNPQEWS